MNRNGATTDATRVRIDSAPSARAKRLAATIGVFVAFAAALFVVSFDPWPGPTLLALSPTHGVDAGDLVVAPLVALALVLVRLSSEPEPPGGSDEVVPTAARWSGPLSAVLLGTLLLMVGISRLIAAGGGPYDRLLAVAVVGAATGFGSELVRTSGRWTGRRGRSWGIPFGLVVLGFLLDLALLPSGTAFGALLLAVWFAATATDRVETIAGWLMAGALALVNAGALVGVADVMARGDGGIERSSALGGVLLVVGLLRVRDALTDQ